MPRGGGPGRDRSRSTGHGVEDGYEGYEGYEGFDEYDGSGGYQAHGGAQDATRQLPRYDGRAPGDGHRDRGYDDRDRGYDDRDQGDDDPRRPPRRPATPRRGRRPRYGLRRALAVVLILLLAYSAAMVWAVLGIWNSVERVDATPTNAARPAAASGQNIVLVGTDSREDLSRDERNELVTGHTEGARADTIMVLHLADSGPPTLLSVPRDSYVEIPGRGRNKINAAYAFGGPPLLVDAVEQATGLPIDGYLEIGFGGFVQVVETVGGVRMCLDEPVVDEKTKLDLPAGCQELAGKEALNYVRMRYGDPRGDLGRVERQRAFLAALTNEMATPQTVLVPWRLHDVGTTTGSALTIGEDTSMLDSAKIAWAMRTVSTGDGQSVTVPVADANYSTPVGSAVLWDEAGAAELFEALRTDAPLSVEP